MYRGFLVEPDGCDACPLSWCDAVKVPAEGNPHAEIAVVGMGPGFYESKWGRPFVGDSGQLLDRMLKEVGLERASLWVTNVACCQPRPVAVGDVGVIIPKGRVEKDSMLKHCRSRILRELAIVKPKVVVALGTITAEAICEGVAGITQLHGALCNLSSESGHNAIVIPLFHPAHLLRGEQRFYPAVVAGLRKARRLAKYGPKPLGQLFLVDPCAARVDDDLDRLERLVDEIIAGRDDIAVDVETTSERQLEAELTVFGFGVAARGARPAMGVAVTLRSWNNLTGTFEFLWNASRWRRVLMILARLLASQNRKIYWNWGFDVTVLERFFGLPAGTLRDGMILHHLDWPDLLHRLDFAVQTELDAPPWKYIYRDKCKRGVATHRDLLIYNAQDCLYTILVFPLVAQNARQRGNIHLEQRQLEVSCLARRAHVEGIPINPRVLAEVQTEHRKLHDDALATMRAAIAAREGSLQSLAAYIQRAKQQRSPGKLFELVDLMLDDFNPNSGDHGRWFLYDFLRLTPQRFTAGGPEKDPKKIVASASYKGVLTFTGNPLVKAYVDRAEEAATLRTLASIVANLSQRTGRLHPSWQTTSMKGTRWVSGGGVNVQNWDATLKRITELDPATQLCWVAADAAAIEYRVAAWLANIPELLSLFNDVFFDEEEEEWKKYDPRYDAHSLVATEVFGDLYTKGDLKLKKALRTMVKRVVYALFYGAYPDKIYETILEDKRVPSDFRAFVAQNKDFIERIRDGFSARFFQWDRFAQRQVAQVRLRDEQIIQPYGRHRPWALSGMVEETKIRNTPIQLAAGEIINEIFLGIDKALRKEALRASFRIHEHDACKFVVHVDDAERAKAVINKEFDRWLTIGDDVEEPRRRIHIYGQAKIGTNLANV